MGSDLWRDDEPDGDAERLRHALMNRLTVVVGYAQLIAGRSDLDAETRSRVEQILSEAGECVRIVEAWSRGLSRHGVRVPDEPRRASTTASHPPPVAHPQQGEGDSPGFRTGRILVVDDEVIIRTLARNVLMPVHDVTTSETAEEALRLLMGDDFDVVLIDLNLGGPIGGRSLYETMRVHHPEVATRVVFMSGGPVGADEIRFLEESGRPYIQKPFTIDTLRAVVRKMMA